MATLTWPEKLSHGSIDVSSHMRVISELVDGRDSAIQLQTLLRKDSMNDLISAALAQEVAEKILRSFSESIHMLSSVESGEVCDDGGSENSGAGKKRSNSGSKNGRGCYWRRKGSHTRTVVSTTVEDDYAWRKYGQKEILNAKFPRCYFRCTHKHDQGCGATKQVQRMEEDPQKYRITYIGVHTCQSNNKLSPQIITDTDPWEFSDRAKPQVRDVRVRAPATVKQEYFKVDTSRDEMENSFSPLGSIFEREPGVAYDNNFGVLDMDEFMASCAGLDAGDFHAFDETGTDL